MTETVYPDRAAVAWVVIRDDYSDYDDLTDARLAASGVHTFAEAREIADGFSLEPIVVPASRVPHLVAPSPAAQDVLDAFVPAPSVVDVMDPAAEAKGRAIAAGVEDATGRAMPDDTVPSGTTWVWAVVGGTRTASAFIALLSSDEGRAWDIAGGLVRIARGVRVERHPLI